MSHSCWCSTCRQEIVILKQFQATLGSSNKEKESTINMKAAENSKLQADIANLKKALADKESVIKAQDSQLQLDEEIIAQLKNEVTDEKATTAYQQETIEMLTVKISKLEDSEAEKTKEISALKEREARSITEISEMQKRIDEKTQESSELKNKITQVEEVNGGKDQIIAKLESEKGNKEVKGDNKNELPCLSIHMNSLLSLNDSNKGWTISISNSQQLKEKQEMITVAVLGMYDVGKSWFCNEFSGSQQYASGYNQTTNSLNFVFPTEEGNLIGLVDTPGSSEAIRVTDGDLLKMIESESNKWESEQKQEKYFWQYKQLKNDAKILQDLKERFISETADVMILICNKLSEKEQEVLYKMVKNFLKVQNARNQKAHKESKQGRETKFFIIHNYKNMGERKQVEDQIIKDLIKSFEIKKTVMFNSKRPEFKTCNEFMYTDQFGVNHLLLACKNSEAGNYYNPPTFGFIKQILSTMVNRTSTDVAKSFHEFCSYNIPKILKHDLKLEYNEERGVIYKAKDSPDIMLENVQYDEFGNFSISTFEPKYSITSNSVNSEQEEVILDVELLDSTFKAKMDKNDLEEPVMRITGEKIVSVGNNCTREAGKFDIKIPLPKDKSFLSSRRVPDSGVPEKGILRWVLTFGPEMRQEL